MYSRGRDRPSMHIRSTIRPSWSWSAFFRNPRVRWTAMASVVIFFLYVSTSSLSTEERQMREARAPIAVNQHPIPTSHGKDAAPVLPKKPAPVDKPKEATSGKEPKEAAPADKPKDKTSASKPKDAAPVNKPVDGVTSLYDNIPKVVPPNMEPKVPLVGTGKPDSVVVPSAILPRFDRFAVALKTGKDVALERTPIQLVTYLQTIRNLIVIGDGSIRIGDKKMIDVISTLYTTDEATQKQARNEPEPSGSQNRRLVRRGPPKGEAVKVDESSTGWRSDGHKNLPGFRELWKRFPDAEWYVMLDDDTYVFFDNLAELLSDYNPEDKLYIGGKNMFIGCDGVKTWGEGPFFAHGGSGIVISRGGMKAMMNGLDACIEKYKSCWAGDVRTALCMRDQGILLTSPGGFHKDPPNDQFGYPKDPCTTPATFHHLLAKQIQRLYDLEEKTREQHGFGFVTFGDLFQDWRTDVTPGMQLHVDRKGNDIANVTLPTAGDCEKRCDDTPTCFTYVYDGTKCWIKDAIPAPVEVKGFVSGVRPDRYQCKITIGDTMEVSSSAPQKGSVASR